jgi:hypothetical protein
MAPTAETDIQAVRDLRGLSLADLSECGETVTIFRGVSVIDRASIPA